MSSGSYFIIYRKHNKKKVSDDVLNALKEEYRKSNNSSFSAVQNKDLDDFPVLMNSSFKVDAFDENDCSVWYDKDGHVYDKLLEFHFGSSFTCLKDKFRTNAYKYSESSVIISRNEAEKMLQAIEYVLSEEYSKRFEDILDNEYVDIFGRGFSPYDERFIKSHGKIYIDKECDSWTASIGDYQWNVEIEESDNDVKSNLKRMRSCLRAFLDAESYEWNGHELVLEYSTY